MHGLQLLQTIGNQHQEQLTRESREAFLGRSTLPGQTSRSGLLRRVTDRSLVSI
jgi:hypothetical protein